MTDFGTSDEYVGVMKGAILSVCPQCVPIDICHEIPPQDASAAARMIESTYKYFPSGTIHMIVVDPGVGSDRAIIAALGDDHYFISPDNGCLDMLRRKGVLDKVHKVENSDFFLNPISRTFHGRDIFAPAAAHLASGIPLDAMGPPMLLSRMKRLDVTLPKINSDGILIGAVTGIDRFGNLLTDLSEKILSESGMLEKAECLQIRIHSHTLHGLKNAYAEVEKGKPLAIIGSRGYVEISVCCGRADHYFKANTGDIIPVFTKKIRSE
jgi:S-adenosylmethionine hydrolase